MLRLIKNILLAGYLWVTLLACVFTMTKMFVPLAPYSIVNWAYGMMAPYQGDTGTNTELVMTGYLANDSTMAIDLAYYLPYGFAERNVRGYLRGYVPQGREAQRMQFVRLGLQALQHERERGVPVHSLAIAMHHWDRSPGGYEFLHTQLFTTIEPITEVRLNP